VWRSATLALASFSLVLSTLALTSEAGATTLAQKRALARTILAEKQKVDLQVSILEQKYVQARSNLTAISQKIANTRSIVANIKRRVSSGNEQLRSDVLFAYVTNGATQGNNPLFGSNAAKVGTINLYSRLAQGNISTRISNLMNYRIQLTAERQILYSQQNQAAALTRVANNALSQGLALQRAEQAKLNSVNSQIRAILQAVQNAQNAAYLAKWHRQHPDSHFPVPPPNSKANIAIAAALHLQGVPYVWGGASRHGVDCSGLIMLAYDSAHIYLSHYSGSQWNETIPVPLYAMRAGDLLFYGWHGDAHVAMYLGRGRMIEAEMTGTRVHVVPVRFGYGFAGVRRPRG
jgi:cell wall-associated NlpC family hydrolase